ncbi:MAG: site-2 protease family protein [Janthinobacterium lividum]
MPDTNRPPAPPQAGFSSLRIATVAGIPIRLHFTFLLFLLWVGLAGPHGAGGLSLLYVLAIFLCVVLHELGHSVVAQHDGIPVADITLYPIGGVARIEKRPTARQELGIAVAGPAVNVVIALVLWAVLTAMKAPLNLASLQDPVQTVPVFLTKVLFANIWLVLFNLIPAFPMDGGRVLRALLALNMPPERATGIAASIGQSIAIVAGIWAIFSGQWFLMFVAFFIYLGAGQEAFAYRQAALGEGVPVRSAMMTDVRTLTVGNTLKEAADVLLDTAQQDFPVMHGDVVQGLLTRDGLLRGLSQQGPSAYVAGAMARQFASVGPDDDLGATLPILQSQSAPLIVLDPEQEGKLLGVITTENVQEYFAVKQIVAARTGANRNGRDERA